MAINLASIQRGKRQSPIRMIVYGADGVGKSTLAAGAPSPIFLDIEDGLGALDVDSWRIETFDELMDAIGVLFDGGHGYKTVVIDTLDWCERLIWNKVIAEYNKTADKPAEVITDLAYGRGYALAVDYWVQLKDGLEALRNAHGMMVVPLAHYKIAKITPPDMLEQYDKYTLDLNDKAASLFKEWCDICLFMNFKIQTTSVKKDGMSKTKITKAVGENIIMGYFRDRPAAYAKTRYELPDEVELPKEGAFDLLLDAIKESFNNTTTEKTNG